MKETPIYSPVLYLQRQYELLQTEYDFEKKQFEQQTEAMGIGRKIKRGICWWPLRVGRAYYNSLNQLVMEVERTEDKDIEHNFEFGKPVCFFTQAANGQLHYYKFVSSVSFVDEDKMVVVMPSMDAVLALQSADNLGVQLYFDETSYRLMFEALHTVANAKGNRLAELRDIFHGTQKTSMFQLPPQRFPWLNQTQESAVNKVLCAKDVAIVHGPPGTGKTTTLVEAIYETLRKENQVLVCAQSNMAVDWISEKLVDRGVSVLRIGNPSRVNDKMLSFTYERQFENHPDYPQLWGIRKAIRELYSQKNKGSNESFHQKINSLKDRANELEIRINESLFSEARVIASTLTSSANRILIGQKYATVFIDEAAQALEASCWIAIQKAHRVILAGDHQQLPPTIKSMEAAHGGLDHTLMQEIVEHHPESVSLLKMQYRMNDAIMKFSSDWFYQGELTSAPEVKYRSILDYDTPIEWIDTSLLEDSHEEFIGESYGRINKPEAEFCLNKLMEYIARIGRNRFKEERLDIGVISPYKAQVQYLRQLIRRNAFFKPYRDAITINTVDGFQGQERDIILISLVRANEDGQIGFLNDLRRMNVAITRARMKLIILGSVPTLTRHKFYKKLWEYAQNV